MNHAEIKARKVVARERIEARNRAKHAERKAIADAEAARIVALPTNWAACRHRGKGAIADATGTSVRLNCESCGGTAQSSAVTAIFKFTCGSPDIEKTECTIGNEKQWRLGNTFGLAMCYGCTSFSASATARAARE